MLNLSVVEYLYQSQNITPPIQYTFKYPSSWSIRTSGGWSGVGLSPNKWVSSVDISILPLRPNGFTSEQVIENDKTYLKNIIQDKISIPLGMADKITGIMNDKNNQNDIGKTWKIIYVKKENLLLRAFLLEKNDGEFDKYFDQILATFRFD